jgi:alpha-galactosidase
MNKKMKYYTSVIFSLSLTLGISSCAQQTATVRKIDSAAAIYTLQNGDLSIEFDAKLYSRIVSNHVAQENVLGDFQASEYLETTDGLIISDFTFSNKKVQTINDELGTGQQVELIGLSGEGIQKNTVMRIYERYPSMAFFTVSYTNNSTSPIKIAKWVNNNYTLAAKNPDNKQADFWSYQGASYADRRDWVSPLTPGFSQQNYMGMNASDYGSGTAIVDVWRKDVGLAVGHSEITPKLVSLPLHYPDEKSGAQLHIEIEKVVNLTPGESMQTIETFVNLHHGDYYATLKQYREVMVDKGLKMEKVPDSAYEAIWCAWGYERNFSVDEVLGTLAKAKEMGLKWAVLDDGWQTSEGDWYLDSVKFPNGDQDMQDFVAKINQAGLKAKLWWAPLAVDPGTDLLHEHSDMLLLDENGKTQDISWWNSYYLCPAYKGTIEYSKALVKKMMGTWGYAGLKIDGQHLNGVAPCYNPKHHHAYPEESVEKLGEFWQEIIKTAQEINPDAVVEICPCGTSYAFHNLPYMNQAVSSDPLSSWQVRLKGKTLKGLMGESAPYYGDHVELSDDASDFASSVGIGAVVGTKFTMPSSTGIAAQFALNPQKEHEWKKWIDIYNQKMLPKGIYLGELYDIGFDLPETHVIQKDGHMYYAFYAKEWRSTVELRGLSNGKYKVLNYYNNSELGLVLGPTAMLNVEFTDYLLLELIPLSE